MASGEANDQPAILWLVSSQDANKSVPEVNNLHNSLQASVLIVFMDFIEYKQTVADS